MNEWLGESEPFLSLVAISLLIWLAGGVFIRLHLVQEHLRREVMGIVQKAEREGAVDQLPQRLREHFGEVGLE